MSPNKPRLAPNATIHRAALRAPRAEADRDLRTRPASAASGTFQSECETSIENICDCIRALCTALEADPLRPQDISRRFGLNKNLTWKIARVLVADSPLDAVAMLPGPEGIEIFLRALESADTGAGGVAVASAAARHSFAVFEEIVVRHFGARTELELVLDGMRTDGNLENSRRLAYRGLSGVVGIQATARFTVHIIGPAIEGTDRADVALVVGLAGLRRLRPGTALPVFRTSGSSITGLNHEPLMHATNDGLGDFLLRDFSSFPHATVRTVEQDGRISVELSDGPLGRVGEANVFFGSVLRRGYSTRRTAGDDTAAFVTSINLPVENFVSDLYVHESLANLESLRTSIHSTLAQPLTGDEALHARSLLPIDLKTQVIADPALAPALNFVPRHYELVSKSFEALGWKREEFRLIRVVLQYPPVPSALFEAWDLPE